MIIWKQYITDYINFLINLDLSAQNEIYIISHSGLFPKTILIYLCALWININNHHIIFDKIIGFQANYY